MIGGGDDRHIRRGVLLCLLSMLVFAAQDGITKFLVKDFPVAQLLMIRYWVFFAFVAIYIAVRSGFREAARSAYPMFQVVRALLAVAEALLFGWGLRYLGLAESHALFAVFPLITLALARWTLGESVSIRQWAATVLGMIGTLIILRPGADVFNAIALVPLCAALVFAMYNILSRKVGRADTFATNVLYMAIVGVVATSCLGIPAWRSPSLVEWLWLSAYSVAGMAGHLLLIMALAYAPATVLQPFNYTLLMFAAIVGLVVFGEIPGVYTLCGGGVILLAGLYSIRAR
ncbi:MAG TPA: DMT family transporter [Pseudomonas sp.]|uniref:DMT family transporter n=1 Tax=Pseudomonas sp. TaxID=306 RepID=UPI002B46D14D|nr:DMT family transporter [Pseudomonas sp.]HKS15499.1 DMT family transporter [Pseudomonas sp.]